MGLGTGFRNVRQGLERGRQERVAKLNEKINEYQQQAVPAPGLGQQFNDWAMKSEAPATARSYVPPQPGDGMLTGIGKGFNNWVNEASPDVNLDAAAAQRAKFGAPAANDAWAQAQGQVAAIPLSTGVKRFAAAAPYLDVNVAAGLTANLNKHQARLGLATQQIPNLAADIRGDTAQRSQAGEFLRRNDPSPAVQSQVRREDAAADIYNKRVNNRLAVREVASIKNAQQEAGYPVSTEQAVNIANEMRNEEGLGFKNRLANTLSDEQAQEISRFAGDVDIDNLVGAGSFAEVYKGESPGTVAKVQAPVVEFGFPDSTPYLYENKPLQEADLMARAGSNIAPTVDYVETNPSGMSVISMQDVRDNYESGEDFMNRKMLQYHNDPTVSGDEAVRNFTNDMSKLAIAHNKQIAELGLKGVGLSDRHLGNIHINEMSGRPIQVDFGGFESERGFVGGRRLENRAEQAQAINQSVFKGMVAAGLDDEAQIYSGTVMDLLVEGKVDDAYDVARQGLAQLQKIKGPVDSVNVLPPVDTPLKALF